MKTEIYFDILLRIAPESRAGETLPAALALEGFDGFLEEENDLHCYIPQRSWHYSAQQALTQLVTQYSRSEVSLLSITEIVNRNWNEEWEQSIQPLWVTENICITPSWHTVPPKEKSIILTIDPKMSFGTGYHESTRLMLRLMEKYIKPGCTVLDIGTGTGILAIAAVKLGAKKALGIDIDEWSADNGIENIQRNGLEYSVEIRLGSLESVGSASFECIFANIQRTTILELLPDIVRKLPPGGSLFLSGLLATEQEMIGTALKEFSCHTIEIMRENEWIAIAAEYLPS